MLTFYRAVIENVLTFLITLWFGSFLVKEKFRLNRVVKTASRIIGRALSSLESLYQQHLLGRSSLISQNLSHPAHDRFAPLPSNRPFRSIKTRTSFPQLYKPYHFLICFSVYTLVHLSYILFYYRFLDFL